MKRLQVLFMLVSCCLCLRALGQDRGTQSEFAIVIHGGAGGDPSRWPEEFRQQRVQALEATLEHGVSMLTGNAKAVDVVESVVRRLEEHAAFNAGRGCVLNERGEHELDASIMDGSNLDCGAVASVRTVKHPISLARKVMTETRHVLLMGSGAEEFGKMVGAETAEAEYFRTARQKKNWRDWKQSRDAASKNSAASQKYFGTVGCVVLDRHGNLAAATSTGGLMGKQWGRVGDSPIIGAGNYADNATCAVSGTGVGEEFIRRAIASDVAARMRYANLDLATAAAQAVGSLPENTGGIIAVDREGHIVMQFNTVAMSRAFANSKGKRGVFLGSETPR